MFTRGVNSPEITALVVAALVHESISFHVEPLPDDDWDITVKPDAARLLERVIAEVEHNA